MSEPITLTINGAEREVRVESRALLVHVLRDTLDLTGTHVGCDTSQCGACTVLIDGRAVKSCAVLAVDGGPACAARQPLPLHRLPEHRGLDPRGGESDAREKARREEVRRKDTRHHLRSPCPLSLVPASGGAKIPASSPATPPTRTTSNSSQPGFSPETAGLKAALPFVDEYVACGNVASLEALAQRLAGLTSRTRSSGPYILHQTPSTPST